MRVKCELMNLFDKAPVVAKDASVSVAPTASVIGDVKVGQRSSIWYGCVLRGTLLCSLNMRIFMLANSFNICLHIIATFFIFESSNA